MNNFRYLGLALEAYRTEHGRYPPAALRDRDGRPLLSWRVLLLPYLEQKELYDQFRLDEPWDSAHNKPLLEQMPRIYEAGPGNPSGAPHTTFDQAFVGKHTVIDGDGLDRARIEAADGLANTILIVEAGQSVPWTAPMDLPFAAEERLPPLGDLYRNEHYINPRGKFLALFADGSVRCFYHEVPEPLIRPLITWNGGEPVDWKRLEPWIRDSRGNAGQAKPAE